MKMMVLLASLNDILSLFYIIRRTQEAEYGNYVNIYVKLEIKLVLMRIYVRTTAKLTSKPQNCL